MAWPESLVKITFSGFFSIVLLAAIISLASMRVREFEERVNGLETRQLELAEKLQDAESENLELKSRLSEKEKEIDELNRPKRISGTAQFPIARVLAQSKDTVELLAERESTSAEVIFALNPWLGNAEALIKGQAIWVPVNQD